MIILVINSGSSSLKYQVRDTGSGEQLADGTVERIGDPSHGGPADHQEALDRVTADVEQALHGKSIDAVGHRVVHGGERFSEPVLVDNEITRAIERLSPLAPLHNPANVQGIRAITAKWPDMPQVAVFDTAFQSRLHTADQYRRTTSVASIRRCYSTCHPATSGMGSCWCPSRLL